MLLEMLRNLTVEGGQDDYVVRWQSIIAQIQKGALLGSAPWDVPLHAMDMFPNLVIKVDSKHAETFRQHTLQIMTMCLEAATKKKDPMELDFSGQWERSAIAWNSVHDNDKFIRCTRTCVHGGRCSLRINHDRNCMRIFSTANWQRRVHIFTAHLGTAHTVAKVAEEQIQWMTNRRYVATRIAAPICFHQLQMTIRLHEGRTHDWCWPPILGMDQEKGWSYFLFTRAINEHYEWEGQEGSDEVHLPRILNNNFAFAYEGGEMMPPLPEEAPPAKKHKKQGDWPYYSPATTSYSAESSSSTDKAPRPPSAPPPSRIRGRAANLYFKCEHCNRAYEEEPRKCLNDACAGLETAIVNIASKRALHESGVEWECIKCDTKNYEVTACTNCGRVPDAGAKVRKGAAQLKIWYLQPALNKEEVVKVTPRQNPPVVPKFFTVDTIRQGIRTAQFETNLNKIKGYTKTHATQIFNAHHLLAKWTPILSDLNHNVAANTIPLFQGNTLQNMCIFRDALIESAGGGTAGDDSQTTLQTVKKLISLHKAICDKYDILKMSSWSGI